MRALPRIVSLGVSTTPRSTDPVPANGFGPRSTDGAPRPTAWSASERLAFWITPMMSCVVFMKGKGR